MAVPVYPPRRNRSLNRIQAIADDADARVALTTELVLNRVMPLIDETPHLKQLTWLPTCQVPRGDGTGLDHARRPRRHAGLPAIHVRLDRHAEGRRAEPRQSGSQLGVDLLFVRARPLGQGRLLVAELSRHGADRRHLAAALHRTAQRPDVADELLAEAVPLAVGDHAIPRHHQRRARISPTTCASARSPPSSGKPSI